MERIYNKSINIYGENRDYRWNGRRKRKDKKRNGHLKERD